jgi:ubiquinone biosynthesis protein UbiJ
VRPFELTAASDVLVGSANVASLPLQNLITVLNALAGAAGGSNGTGGAGATSLQALANVLYSQLVVGTLTSASASTAINAALATEQTALTNLAATPGKILNTDLAALSALFGGSTTSQASVQPALNSAPVTQFVTGTNVVDVVNVASLPLQNGITALNALAGAAGGGNGTGGGGATSFQALPNLLYSQLVAGTLTEASATTAINAAVTTEQTALTNLAATPGKIIATDLAATQKLASGSAASTLSPAKQQSDTPALKNSDVNVEASKVAGDEGAKDTTAGSTTRARHAAKATDNSPVSTAIKAIKEASKGSYVGKHRADTVGAKGASGNEENGSKGSTEK